MNIGYLGRVGWWAPRARWRVKRDWGGACAREAGGWDEQKGMLCLVCVHGGQPLTWGSLSFHHGPLACRQSRQFLGLGPCYVSHQWILFLRTLVKLPNPTVSSYLHGGTNFYWGGLLSVAFQSFSFLGLERLTRGGRRHASLYHCTPTATPCPTWPRGGALKRQQLRTQRKALRWGSPGLNTPSCNWEASCTFSATKQEAQTCRASRVGVLAGVEPNGRLLTRGECHSS